MATLRAESRGELIRFAGLVERLLSDIEDGSNKDALPLELAVDRVPTVYFDAQARLNCQRSVSVSETEGPRFSSADRSEAASTSRR